MSSVEKGPEGARPWVVLLTDSRVLGAPIRVLTVGKGGRAVAGSVLARAARYRTRQEADLEFQFCRDDHFSQVRYFRGTPARIDGRDGQEGGDS